MLNNSVIDPEVRRRQALSKVYSLLITLASESTHPATLPEDLNLRDKIGHQKPANSRVKKMATKSPSKKQRV